MNVRAILAPGYFEALPAMRNPAKDKDSEIKQ